VPFISLTDLDRQIIGHRAAVLMFTAPGCASCAAEARALSQALGGHPRVQLVGVDMSPDAPADLAAYLKFIGVADSPFVWMIDSNSAVTNRYQIAALSSTIGIDHSGKVRFSNQGPAEASLLIHQIQALS